jgi:hypothetical protein
MALFAEACARLQMVQKNRMDPLVLYLVTNRKDVFLLESWNPSVLERAYSAERPHLTDVSSNRVEWRCILSQSRS